MIVDQTGEAQQSIEDMPRNNCFKFKGKHAAQLNFCRYESLCPKAEIHRVCFPWNFAKF